MADTKISRTPAGNGSATIGTFSAWVKRGNMGVDSGIFSSYVSASDFFRIQFDVNDILMLGAYVSSSWILSYKTTRKFRDPSAWYHIVCSVDSTDGTPADRQKIYINGVRETEFTTSTDLGSSDAMPINQTTDDMRVGQDNSNYWTGCISHVHWIDGTAYAASDFGETDATSGMWKIKTSPSVTYGTNGFFLKMEDSSNMDLDSGTNAFTNFTTAGTLTATKDNPDNNFATMNPLVYGTSQTYSNGNNTITNSGATWEQTFSTLGVSAGKWYWEAKFVSGTWVVTGVDSVIFYSPSTIGYTSTSVGYKSDNGNVAVAASIIDTEATYAPGDIISVALDMDNDAVYFAKDGVWINSGDPTSGASKTGAYTLPVANTTYFPTMGLYNTEVDSLNFGNGYFGTTVVASTNADDAGIGSFEYDVPAGFYTLCTKNIKAYGG